jgi:hypothetical protein
MQERAIRFAALLVTVFCAIAAWPLPARAQHADAGVEHAAAPAPVEPKAPAEPPGVLPKTIDPNMLSERTRASLQERSAGRHASSLPAPNADTARDPSRLQDTPSSSATFRQRAGSEPQRRGEAHLRRVQAVETDEGVTLLSNRIKAAQRVSDLIAKTPPAPLDERAPAQEEVVAAAGESASITETRSLRPSSARTTSARNASRGLGWLVWPFVLFVTAGAVLGTLWFRKKTE